MKNEIFQEVFDLLQDHLEGEWGKLVFYSCYTDGSYSMKFYVSDDKGVYTDCYSQKNANHTQLIRLFVNIDKILSPERNKLDFSNQWSVMTMVVFSDGNMKTEFDYTDISENTIAYERLWKEKYLN